MPTITVQAVDSNDDVIRIAYPSTLPVMGSGYASIPVFVYYKSDQTVRIVAEINSPSRTVNYGAGYVVVGLPHWVRSVPFL